MPPMATPDFPAWLHADYVCMHAWLSLSNFSFALRCSSVALYHCRMAAFGCDPYQLSTGRGGCLIDVVVQRLPTIACAFHKSPYRPICSAGDVDHHGPVGARSEQTARHDLYLVSFAASFPSLHLPPDFVCFGHGGLVLPAAPFAFALSLSFGQKQVDTLVQAIY